jgi:hypothetical protein
VLHLIDGDTGTCRDCGFVNPPCVQWNHIDGPMMVRGNHTLKWLTWRERFMHWIGRWSLEDIARRPSPW